MVVLRSRAVLSAVTSITSKPLATENAIVEPSKTFELLNVSPSMNTTPSSSSPTPGTGSLTRRSARLAGKMDKGENLELGDVEVGSGERKQVEGHFGNLEKQDLDLDNRDMGDEAKKGEGVSISGLMETVSGSGRRKRKLSVDPNEREKKFMGLRSGKQVLKIKMKDGDDDRGDNVLDGIANGKKSDLVSSDDDFVEEVTKNVLKKEERVSREKKGKGKVGKESLSMKSEKYDSKEVVIKTCVMTRGKMKSFANASSSLIENVHENSVSGANDLDANEELSVEAPPQSQQEHVNHLPGVHNNIRNAQRQRHRNFARQNAARFAIFTPEQELGEDGAAPPDGGVEDWPGPILL